MTGSVLAQGRDQPADPAVQRQVEVALLHGETVALAGAAGTGKLHTALRMLPGAVVVEPARDPEWFTTARDVAAQGRALVLRRLHRTPGPAAAQMEELIDSGARIAITVDLDAADDAVVGAVRRVATTVRLPVLAQHIEHLPALVRAMLAELPRPGSGTRLAPAVWERLAAWHWPGNHAELRATVHRLGSAATRSIARCASSG